MTPITLIVDFLAAAAIGAGAFMVFGRNRLRAWWNRKAGKPELQIRGDDPLAYALTIFGAMLLAFGVIILGFFTVFALSTG